MLIYLPTAIKYYKNQKPFSRLARERLTFIAFFRSALVLYRKYPYNLSGIALRIVSFE